MYQHFKKQGLKGAGWFTGPQEYINFEEKRILGEIHGNTVYDNPNLKIPKDEHICIDIKD